MNLGKLWSCMSASFKVSGGMWGLGSNLVTLFRVGNASRDKLFNPQCFTGQCIPGFDLLASERP